MCLHLAVKLVLPYHLGYKHMVNHQSLQYVMNFASEDAKVYEREKVCNRTLAIVTISFAPLCGNHTMVSV